MIKPVEGFEPAKHHCIALPIELHRFAVSYHHQLLFIVCVTLDLLLDHVLDLMLDLVWDQRLNLVCEAVRLNVWSIWFCQCKLSLSSSKNTWFWAEMFLSETGRFLVSPCLTQSKFWVVPAWDRQDWKQLLSESFRGQKQGKKTTLKMQPNSLLQKTSSEICNKLK